MSPIKTTLVPREIIDMIDSADNLRDKVVLAFLGDVGCRVSELLAITVNSVDVDRKVVIIPHLKRGVKKHCPQCGRTAGRNTKFCSKCGCNLSNVEPEGIEERTRMISIGSETASLLREYIQDIPDKNTRIIPLTRQMVYKIVRNAADAVGMTGRILLNPESGKLHYVHPHDFRSALAVSWLDYAGTDANKQKALQSHLGHRNFETTMRYNKLTPSLVSNVGDEVRNRRFGK